MRVLIVFQLRKSCIWVAKVVTVTPVEEEIDCFPFMQLLTRAHIEAEVGVTTTILQQKYTPLHATVYAILYYKIRTLFNTETDI